MNNDPYPAKTSPVAYDTELRFTGNTLLNESLFIFKSTDLLRCVIQTDEARVQHLVKFSEQQSLVGFRKTWFGF